MFPAGNVGGVDARTCGREMATMDFSAHLEDGAFAT
jgi:hypothetical protein